MHHTSTVPMSFIPSLQTKLNHMLGVEMVEYLIKIVSKETPLLKINIQEYSAELSSIPFVI